MSEEDDISVGPARLEIIIMTILIYLGLIVVGVAAYLLYAAGSL